MRNKCSIIIVLLLCVIAGGAYKFLFQGSVTTGADGRTSILLTEGERDLVLSEMRAFLISIQQINQGIAVNDMKRVAEYSRKVGMAAQAAVPGTLVGKLPMAFKQLGFDTHTRFDQLAMDTDDLADSNHALVQVTELMQNCVVCHEAYRIDVAPR